MFRFEDLGFRKSVSESVKFCERLVQAPRKPRESPTYPMQDPAHVASAQEVCMCAAVLRRRHGCHYRSWGSGVSAITVGALKFRERKFNFGERDVSGRK